MKNRGNNFVSMPQVAIALGLALAGPSAMAATSWGTSAEAFNINCSSADCSGGGTSGGDSMFPGRVSNFQGTPATQSVAGSLGTATATANFQTLAPGLSTMKITGEASGGAQGAGSARAHTLDLYTYSGPPTTVTMTVDLTGTHVGPTSGADSNLDGIRGDIYLFTNPSAIEDIDNEMSPRLFCLFECYSPDDNLTLTIDDGSGPVSDTFVLNLEDGDQFYVYSNFNIGAAGGGSAASLDSFTYSFSPATGLTSLSAGGGGTPDADGDGVSDDVDNCILVSNPGQQDTNADGYGNACDPDLNNDGVINTIDLGLLRSVFFTANADADFNSDGNVNTVDLGTLRAFFFGPPGPSAIAP